MYIITVLTSGKYHNVTLGHRVVFTRFGLKHLTNNFYESDCSFTVEKTFKLYNLVFGTRLIYSRKAKREGE